MGAGFSVVHSRSVNPAGAAVVVLALNVSRAPGCGAVGCTSSPLSDAIGCIDKVYQTIVDRGEDPENLHGKVIGFFEESRRLMAVVPQHSDIFARLRAVAVKEVSPAFAQAEAGGSARIIVLLPIVGLVADHNEPNPEVVRDLAFNLDAAMGLFGTAAGGGLKRVFEERHQLLAAAA